MTPRYHNPCNQCLFLGQYKENDLYYCQQYLDAYIIMRFQKDEIHIVMEDIPPEEMQMISDHPSLQQAFFRAQQAILPFTGSTWHQI